MKKYRISILALLLSLSLTACGGNSVSNAVSETAAEQTAAEVQTSQNQEETESASEGASAQTRREYLNRKVSLQPAASCHFLWDRR